MWVTVIILVVLLLIVLSIVGLQWWLEHVCPAGGFHDLKWMGYWSSLHINSELECKKCHGVFHKELTDNQIAWMRYKQVRDDD